MIVRIVHCADVHLDSPLRGLEAYEGAPVAEMRGATRAAFDNVVDLCIDEEAGLLLIAGDLFDRDWQDFNTGLFLVRGALPDCARKGFGSASCVAITMPSAP